MTDIVWRDTTSVRANWGRWVSDCVTPGCTNGWQVNMGIVLWMCRECWAVMRPVWPPDPLAIEWILSQRPDPTTRNWDGETMAELFAENAAHGIIPDSVLELDETSDVLTEINGSLVSGAVLPAVQHYRELAGAPGARPALHAA